jgi:hypothetical protein
LSDESWWERRSGNAKAATIFAAILLVSIGLCGLAGGSGLGLLSIAGMLFGLVGLFGTAVMAIFEPSMPASPQPLRLFERDDERTTQDKDKD